MNARRIHRKIDRTPEDLARIKAIREKFQRERPTHEELIASGEWDGPFPTGEYLEVKQALHELKKLRQEAGLSLDAVAERSGIDKAALSRMENGHHANPTFDTLYRYAQALGKQLVLRFVEAGSGRSH